MIDAAVDARSNIMELPLHSTIQDDGVSLDDIDAAVCSPVTCASVGVILDLTAESEHIGNWAEGCPCHPTSPSEDVSARLEVAVAIGPMSTAKKRRVQPQGFRTHLGCPFKGCRAPELVCGVGHSSVMQRMIGHRNRIVYHFASLPAPHNTDLVAQYEKARSRLWRILVANVMLIIIIITIITIIIYMCFECRC